MKGTDLMQALGGVPEEYIARALEDSPPQKRTAFLVSKPFLAGVSTAACLLLIVGVGVGVWSRQQRIEPLPPQETQTTTVTQTESRTETTVQFTTATQTASRPPETTERSTTISSRVQPSVSEAALLTSVPRQGSTVVTTAAKQTTAAEVAPGTPSDVTHTALPQTSVKPQTTAGIAAKTTNRATDATETALPVTTKQVSTSTNTAPPSTNPATKLPTTEPMTEEETETVKETEMPTQAPTIASTQIPTECYIPPTESATEASADLPELSGFTVQRVGTGAFICIKAKPREDVPTDFSVPYSMQDERFEMLSEDTISDTRMFRIYDHQTGQELTIYQRLHNDFQLMLMESEFAQIKESSSCICFESQGILYWDDGHYIMYTKAIELKIPEIFRADVQ